MNGKNGKKSSQGENLTNQPLPPVSPRVCVSFSHLLLNFYYKFLHDDGRQECVFPLLYGWCQKRAKINSRQRRETRKKKERKRKIIAVGNENVAGALEKWLRGKVENQ